MKNKISGAAAPRNPERSQQDWFWFHIVHLLCLEISLEIQGVRIFGLYLEKIFEILYTWLLGLVEHLRILWEQSS